MLDHLCMLLPMCHYISMWSLIVRLLTLLSQAWVATCVSTTNIRWWQWWNIEERHWLWYHGCSVCRNDEVTSLSQPMILLFYGATDLSLSTINYYTFTIYRSTEPWIFKSIWHFILPIIECSKRNQKLVCELVNTKYWFKRLQSPLTR